MWSAEDGKGVLGRGVFGRDLTTGKESKNWESLTLYQINRGPKNKPLSREAFILIFMLLQERRTGGLQTRPRESPSP